MSTTRVLAVTLAAVLLAWPSAGAQASTSGDGSALSGEPSATGPSSTGLSSVDTAVTVSSGSSLSSNVALSSVPALVGAILAEGALGSSLFGVPGRGPSSSGPQDVSATFPPELGPAGSGAELRSVEHVTGDLHRFEVYSPSMDRIVRNEILLPGGAANTAARPTFYLLMGADGAHSGWTWARTTDYESFFADRQVNVVTPIGSVSSMQTNWYDADPVLGDNQWGTYLVNELPEIVDTHFHGSGRDAVGGVSMSGGPAFDLAAIAPDRFVAAASYSGCPATEGLFGSSFTRAAVTMNGGTPDNMWGSAFDPAWAAHNPAANLDRLAGTALFVSAAHGIPGEIDNQPSSRPLNPIETASYVCSDWFVDHARSFGHEVDWYPLAEGAHSWGLFEHQMRTSWRTIGPALGVE
ncbi:alpha/beta hydrolase [Corynebacterium guangdongense]|uniref:S-formylglutathione hydrolase FrmB n=1 Tax=Corynebacterium guangdongense TaxID=1783348 RepID=A0ABU1ZZ82_9CORY|nr:alpha/beta hydrolase family protein [Corynebacterium guangdongense]MDR7330231.1 S-formylglutathione hydrolase FrmB [Corynebacterium guangdongense]WJZ18789.1 Diacylglycerol acyltransferase/mycolyltransferase Ag85C precursor [Corynebacterium guangdongense]